MPRGQLVESAQQQADVHGGLPVAEVQHATVDVVGEDQVGAGVPLDVSLDEYPGTVDVLGDVFVTPRVEEGRLSGLAIEDVAAEVHVVLAGDGDDQVANVVPALGHGRHGG